MVTITKSLVQRCATGLTLGTTLAILYIYLPPIFLSCVFGAIIMIILITEWPRLCIPKPLLLYITPLYPVTPFMLLIVLNQQPAYHHLIAFIFIFVFSHDTASYIAGNLFGRHHIYPTVSPGKTWEGFIGGCIGAMSSVALFFNHPHTITSWLFYIALLITLCCISLTGDLFESWLKRKARLKDSGSLLPGHGGLLDRFDSILFVTVAVYSIRNYLITLL